MAYLTHILTTRVAQRESPSRNSGVAFCRAGKFKDILELLVYRSDSVDYRFTLVTQPHRPTGETKGETPLSSLQNIGKGPGLPSLTE